MRVMRKQILLWLLAVLLLQCVGCQQESEMTGLRDGQYYTYYVNSSGTALVSRIYEPASTDTMGIVTELFAQCQIAPEGEGRRAIPGNVVVTEPPRLEERIVNLYFDTTYTTMDQVTELLCKAAMAKTITQLKEVDYIRIHINGEVYRGFNTYIPNADGEAAFPGTGNTPEDGRDPMGGENNNEPMGLQPLQPAEKTLWSGSDFLDNTGDDTNKYVSAELVLYFGNEEGKALVSEVREVVYSSALFLERVVLNQLIEGPKEENMTATLPQNLKIQGVSVRDGVCYVDFDAAFLEDPVNVTDQVEIYSIVNSLTELSNVQQVQITVNGSPDVMLRNNISLASRFEKDLNMIAVEESEEEPQNHTQESVTPVETEPDLSETEPVTQWETELENPTESEETVDGERSAEESSTEEATVEVVSGL